MFYKKRCSIRKGVLRNFTKFTGKHLCESLFFNEVAGLKNTFLQNTSGWTTASILYYIPAELYESFEPELDTEQSIVMRLENLLENSGKCIVLIFFELVIT